MQSLWCLPPRSPLFREMSFAVLFFLNIVSEHKLQNSRPDWFAYNWSCLPSRRGRVIGAFIWNAAFPVQLLPMFSSVFVLRDRTERPHSSMTRFIFFQVGFLSNSALLLIASELLHFWNDNINNDDDHEKNAACFPCSSACFLREAGDRGERGVAGTPSSILTFTV